MQCLDALSSILPDRRFARLHAAPSPSPSKLLPAVFASARQALAVGTALCLFVTDNYIRCLLAIEFCLYAGAVMTRLYPVMLR